MKLTPNICKSKNSYPREILVLDELKTDTQAFSKRLNKEAEKTDKMKL